jgi:hypothetical protein
MTTTEYRVSGESVSPSPVPTAERGGVPAHQKWYRFVRKWAVLFWLAISLAGLTMALVPATYPAKILLSSAIVGAGIAGLMSEFNFSVDRRDADTNMRFERQHEASLENQIDSLEHGLSQVDALVKRTKIVATNQLFQLGLDLYMIRFCGEDQVASFTEQAQKLADILGLSAAVQRFVDSPYLRPTEPFTAEQDPFPDLGRVIQLRYAQEGIEAFKAGSTIGLIVTAPGNLAQPDYRDLAVTTLDATLKLLYLLPQVNQNVQSAMGELQRGACSPAVFAQYLTLFSFYLTYLMTGRNEDVVHLFESPVSLTEPSRAAEITGILTRYAGESGETPEPAATGVPAPEPAATGVPAPEPAATGGPRAAPRPEARPEAAAPEPKVWYKFLRSWSVFFWCGVSVIGLILAFLPVDFTARDLLSSAIVGAGIAGLTSEFTFWPDRRKAETDLQVQRSYETGLELQVEMLEHQVDQVDELIRRAEIVSITQLFKLGVDLHMVRFTSEDLVSKEQLALFGAEAEELAIILGLSPAVGTFVTSPYLRVPDGEAPEGQDPWPDLIRAVELRYPQEGIEAFKAGSAMAVIINTPGEWHNKGYQQNVANILLRAIEVLYLRPVVHDNMVRAIDELLSGMCQPNYFAVYLILFYFYLSYRATGEHPEVASFFEAPVSLTQPATAAEMTRLLELTGGNPSAAPVPSGSQRA